MRKLLIGAVMLLCLFAGACSTVRKADLVLRVGEIYTMEPDHPWAKAMGDFWKYDRCRARQ